MVQKKIYTVRRSMLSFARQPGGGTRVIGVVLTGAREDGKVGMRAIKQRGGIATFRIPQIKTAVSDGQSIKTAPIHARVTESSNNAGKIFVHTIVPIINGDSSVNRVFIYSEKAE